MYNPKKYLANERQSKSNALFHFVTLFIKLEGTALCS
jgi:hypothetical protein